MGECIELGGIYKKPGCLSHILFSRKVYNWLLQNKMNELLIHSYEGISCHHVNTIHSSPFNFPKKEFRDFVLL